MGRLNSNAIKEVKVADPVGLMFQYKETGNIEIRNQLVMHYLQHVNVAIYSMRSILLSDVPFEDFFNQGIIALIDCIERYDPYRGEATFDTYSYTGIRGAILKYLRKQNWLPNRLWEAQKKLSQGRVALEQQLMREPTHAEIAEYMELSERKLSQYMIEMSVVDTISFEELLNETHRSILNSSLSMDAEKVDHNVLLEELHGALAEAIDKLPAKQKQIIALYYYEHLNLREIGEILNLSQQRISQLRKKTLEQLELALREFRY